MRRKSYRKYIFLGAVLFLLLSLPLPFIERVRGFTIGLFSKTIHPISFKSSHKMKEERLEGDNHLLRLEIGKLKSLLDQQSKVAALEKEQKQHEPASIRYTKSGFLLQLLNQTIPARVIYRDPSSWSSSLWINVGQETNNQLGEPIICKNSPVIIGRALVGAVDYVGKKISRVRLITDMALKPSVRAVRGYPQNAVLFEQIGTLLKQLLDRADLPLSSQEQLSLCSLLERLQSKLLEMKESHYLAKGVLQGAGTPLWRSLNHNLKGIGFNYDFSDEEGPARSLVAGQPLCSDSLSLAALPIIQQHDLLVTTGIDGVFPPGLYVAEVTKILPLKEGAFTYNIEASPIVKNLDTVQTLFIMPPLVDHNKIFLNFDIVD